MSQPLYWLWTPSKAVVANGATTAPFLLFLLQNRTGARPHAENKKSKRRCLNFLLLRQRLLLFHLRHGAWPLSAQQSSHNKNSKTGAVAAESASFYQKSKFCCRPQGDRKQLPHPVQDATCTLCIFLV